MAQHLLPDPALVSPADCSLVRTHLDAFVDGELMVHDAHDRRLRQTIDTHLRDCAECTRVAQQVRALLAALRAVGAREQDTVRASEALRRRAEIILSSR